MKENKTEDTISLFLTDSTTNISQDAHTVFIEFTPEQSFIIAAESSFGTSNDNFYITIGDEAVQDFFGNGLQEISEENAFPVSLILPDKSGPSLIEFILDIDRSTLNLTFSEVINATTFNATGITLRGGQDSNAVSYTLTEGNIGDDHYSVSILLTSTDLNEIKSLSGLGNSTF